MLLTGKNVSKKVRAKNNILRLKTLRKKNIKLYENFMGSYKKSVYNIDIAGEKSEIIIWFCLFALFENTYLISRAWMPFKCWLCVSKSYIIIIPLVNIDY